MSKNNIYFILHKPQLSENIGACARAIKNFNFKKLVLINPKPIFPNDKILATSVGAKDIIKQSKKYDNLEKALSKIDIVIATSARFRNKNIKHINLDDLKKINFKKNIGFLFGSEASGLSNDEISYANYTLQIPKSNNNRVYKRLVKEAFYVFPLIWEDVDEKDTGRENDDIEDDYPVNLDEFFCWKNEFYNRVYKKDMVWKGGGYCYQDRLNIVFPKPIFCD